MVFRQLKMPNEIASSTSKPAMGAYTVSDDPTERGEAARSALAPPSAAVYALAIAAFALHVGFSGRFGFFRDELYYAACGENLAWGFVNHESLDSFFC
jgi:hypothetical protein